MVPGMAYAQTQGDVVFEIRATRTPAVYQIGERIYLELSFSAPVSGKYGITSTSEQRDASLLNETYSVSPAAGAIDPQESEQALPWGFGGSFLSGQRALAEEPIIRHADLNEWKRFTRPGHYLLRAVSPRAVALRQWCFEACDFGVVPGLWDVGAEILRADTAAECKASCRRRDRLERACAVPPGSQSQQSRVAFREV
jgi:hypothetical protein